MLSTVKEFFHSGSLGDIIYSLPSILAVGGGKINIAKRPHYDILHTLLEIQPNIEVGYGWAGINLDEFRIKNDNKKHLALCHADVLNTAIDITNEWLFNIKPIKKVEIVINRTRHYHDKNEVDWSLLKDYSERILFIGHKDEFAVFKKRFVPSITKYWYCTDALEIAGIIKGSKLFIGNQSFCYAIAEAMKHPRVLEICHTYDNCRPSGNNWYATLTKGIIDQCLLK